MRPELLDKIKENIDNLIPKHTIPDDVFASSIFKLPCTRHRRA